MQNSESAALAAGYLRFAETEAHSRSPLYEVLARSVAANPEILAFLLTVPRPKRQPNLLLAAVRFLFGTPADPDEFRRNVLGNRERVRALLLERATQTNEPARCAALLPVLARLPQPLALLEVGASAGLCLLPDRYAYDYGGRILRPATASPKPPVFPCTLNAAAPLPAALPEIVWRAGLDLNPINIAEPNEAAWLETLVWPEQSERLMRLRAAIAIAREARPHLVRGDLRRDLARLAAEAPQEATLVIFHTAVLAYLPPEDRAAFAGSMQTLCPFWIANEAPQIFPDIAARAPGPAPPGHFLLSVNGTPTAWTDPHGAALAWFG
jgi:hypothetical protein